MKHSCQFSVKSYFINRFEELSTSFMFYQMQEIAWEHANILGFGYEQLKPNNQFWVLSRLHVKIERRPGWRESIQIETWSRGTDGFYGYRDFNFTDSKGNSIIQATSSWLILDQNTKKIVRLNNFKEFPEYNDSLLGYNPAKLKPPKSDEKLKFSPVLFNEIDINQHFNSGRYIERIIDSYSFEFHKAHEISELEINFLKEGMPEDKLAVKKQKIDNHVCICSVIRESDNANLIIARITWKDRNLPGI